jgi:hypothetical protein
MGFMFYEDLWHNPDTTPDICDYVGELWNEYSEVSTYVLGFGEPRGPVSYSNIAEEP